MQNITQAILPLAGLGTRFLPWTKAVPKEMLPMGNKPIVALIVDECLDAGIRDICFVISKGKELIPQFFQEDAKLEAELERRGKSHLLDELRRYHEVKFHVVYQDQQLGDGHAILQAKDWVTTDVVAVLFGDDLFHGTVTGMQQLVDAYGLCAGGALMAVTDVLPEQTSRYGIVDIESEHSEDPRLKKVKGLVEKPSPADAPSTFGIVGRYLVPRSVLEVLGDPQLRGKDGEVRLIDGFTATLGQLPIFAYHCDGLRLDTGTPEGYRTALGYF